MSATRAISRARWVHALIAAIAACGQEGSAPEPEGVATVAITPVFSSIAIGRTVQLSATALDARGAPLSDRAIVWSTSDPASATVSTTGLVTGVASHTPVRITATSDGKVAHATVNVVDVVVTGISNIHTFLERCPTLDPAYAAMRADFEVRLDGVHVPMNVPCTEPFSAQPPTQLTPQLVILQALRTAYYMSQGTEGKLPWTPKSLWEWMNTDVAGVNLRRDASGASCCQLLDGKRYVSMAGAYDIPFDSPLRSWSGIAPLVSLFAHEVRHADPKLYQHTSGCASSGSSTALLCDPTYDVADLWAYAIQYWMHVNWMTGTMYVGLACAPAAVAQQHARDHAGIATALTGRFVANRPPAPTATSPFGGYCLSS